MKDHKHLTDDDLVKMYAGGDNEAFDALLERYRYSLYSYILFNVRNEDVANDIFQETFVKVITNIQAGNYLASNKFQAWITCIAHNIIMDNFRKQSSDNTVSCDDEDNAILNCANLCDSNIETQRIREQSLSDIVTLYKQLPKPQSEIVFMRFYQDMSFKEIAEELNISINTALGRMRYALINMKRIATQKNLFYEWG